MNFDFVPTTDIEEHNIKLSQAFNNLKTIEGTQKFHCFIPHPSQINTIITKTYYFATNQLSFKLK